MRDNEPFVRSVLCMIAASFSWAGLASGQPFITANLTGSTSVSLACPATVPIGGSITYDVTHGTPSYTVVGAQIVSVQPSSGSIVLDLGLPVAVSGSYQVQLTATDALIPNPPSVATVTVGVTCQGGGPSPIGPRINPVILPPATPGIPYAFTFTATGGTLPYSWSGSGLPSGLSLSSAGVLSGTPALGTPGDYSIQVLLIDGAQAMATSQANLRVNPVIRLTPAGTLPPGVVGVPYSTTIQATGGVPPYTFTVRPPFLGAATPPGLVLNPNGTLTGVPTAPGTYAVTVEVSDTAGNRAAGPYVIVIVPPITIDIPGGLPPGRTGIPYTAPIPIKGGQPPYTVTGTGLPPGTTLTPTGTITGTPTTPGTFPVVIRVTDAVGTTVTVTVPVTITGGPVGLQSTQRSITFFALVGGDSPPPHSIGVYSGLGNAIDFLVRADGGTTGVPAPSWLEVSLSSGLTPSRLTIAANHRSLGVGTYTARVRLTPRDPSESIVDVDVTLKVTAELPKLRVSPVLLRFSARVEVPRIHERVIVVQNSGGAGPLAFTTRVLGGSSWIAEVIPPEGVVQSNVPIFVKVRLNTAGLDVGGYNDVIRFTTVRNEVVDVPVSLWVADRGPILSLDVTGLRFPGRRTEGSRTERTINVLNAGDPLLPVNYTVEIIRGGDWLTVAGPASGTATATSPGAIRLAPGANTATFPMGPRYALVQVNAPGSLNSPQYVSAVLDITAPNAVVEPELVPPGLFFTASTSGAGVAAQTVNVWANSGLPATFQTSQTTTDGNRWLEATPSGRASATTPGTVTVSVNATGLPPGVYMGEVEVGIVGEVRSVNVTMVVTPLSSAVASSKSRSAGCSASRLALTQTGTPNHFTVPAGWPATLIMRLNDDCGSPVVDGSVVANFSNGDPPISLLGDQVTGTYSAAWQPGRVTPQMTVSVFATAGTFDPAKTDLIGTVGPNVNNPPVLAKGGILNNFNPVVGAALAPNTRAQIFGSNLAVATASPDVVPLLTEFSGTSVMIGAFQAPLFFVSSNQLVVQVPPELTANQQRAAVIIANGQLSVPDLLDLVPVAPGLATLPDGSIMAQRAADFSPVNSARPAKPGETVIVYLTGMGSTTPAVKSGTPAPGAEPLARVDTEAKVMVDGAQAEIGYAGLTPNQIGLYQINFVVPPNAKAGELDVVVTQGKKSSNVARLPVAP